MRQVTLAGEEQEEKQLGAVGREALGVVDVWPECWMMDSRMGQGPRLDGERGSCP